MAIRSAQSRVIWTLCMVIRCTTKLLKELGMKLTTVTDGDDLGGELDTWFGNLLRLDRHKCIVFTHAQTLFSFLVPRVRKADLIDFRLFFLSHVDEALRSEGLSVAVLPGIDRDSCMIARTNNRSVLGSMNDLAVQCRVSIEAEGGLSRCDMPRLQRQLNRVPLSAIGYDQAIDRLKELVGPASHPNSLRLVRGDS